ncbi:cytochrome c-type biogenesis protein [Vannielia litorea]|uniref:cytochrome c-type biogenesis protein n=1 Tax=Vannielia litorea TaxID=1217970 RepID=UPI001BCDDF0A|nr:cytochrome c-type biogenesis protein [Vannielia litorea]MBS8226030.1 cytochrome c-type biogenesis protein CcmH [Vannielia litorea]
MRLILIAALLWMSVGPALAVEPDEVLSDPVLEARARALSKELRCVVCQNQDIDSSNAGVARDLRLIVRERLVAGDTDEEVLDYVVARYGDYVLFRPPFKPLNYVLWFAPFVLVLFGGGVAVAVLRGRRSVEPTAALTEDEDKLLNEYLAEDRKTQ